MAYKLGKTGDRFAAVADSIKTNVEKFQPVVQTVIDLKNKQKAPFVVSEGYYVYDQTTGKQKFDFGLFAKSNIVPLSLAGVVVVLLATRKKGKK